MYLDVTNLSILPYTDCKFMFLVILAVVDSVVVVMKTVFYEV
jgi:hypothetical protein